MIAIHWHRGRAALPSSPLHIRTRPIRRTRDQRIGWWFVLTALLALACVVLICGTDLRRARALPSFARQTGQECAACHVAFPELTAFGRQFKLNGYTMTGGESSLPPLAFMLQPAFTHTEAGQSGGAAPHFGPNNNLALQQASLFYGGAVTSNIGAFAQATYDGASRRFGWDNTDLRFALPGSGNAAGWDTIFGVSVNNNPTVQDVWNTTPAWRFPFASSSLAPTPAASPLIEGGLAQKSLGATAYTFWHDLLYAEVGGYRTLSTRTLQTLGADTTGASSIDTVAPYWRLALEPHWNQHSLEIGTFGLSAPLFPQRIRGSGTDRLTDYGVDVQYQFVGSRDQISLQASWIYESQDWRASHNLGLTANEHDWLRTFNLKASYFYDHTYGINLAYFDTSGSGDPVLYSPAPITGSANGRPDSRGWIAEIDYLPFMHGGPSVWPWLNARFALQYVKYDKFNGGTSNFDGSGRKASDNNTLLLMAWIMF